MARKEVAAVAGVLFQLAETVQRLGNDQYKPSAAWNKFPATVALFHMKHDVVEEHFQRLGEPHDQLSFPFVLQALKKAMKLMQEEVDTLHKRRVGAKTSWFRSLGFTLGSGSFGKMNFPDELALAMQNAVDTYDSAFEHLQRVTEYDNELPFHDFVPYVPLQRTESRILFALKSATVVLVHGAAGTGKSTVARHICCNLKKYTTGFDGVVWLQFGPEADIERTQMELLQKLGVDDLTATSRSQSSNQPDFNLMRDLLGATLKRQNVLIVLDDVWESKVLQQFLELSGAGVKYLVTSRLENLCEDLSCECMMVEMEDVETADARSILAVHAGFTVRSLPEYLKDVADRLVEQVHGIPLALAVLGVRIGQAEPNDVEVWESVVADLDLRLCNSLPSSTLPFPSSYWSVLKQTWNSLPSAGKQYLGLLSMCKGPSVPQSVVNFLYAAAFPRLDLPLLRQIQSELKSKHLVVERDRKRFSIHSLIQRFILEETNDFVESIASCFYGGNPPVPNQTYRVTVVLLVLYLLPEFSRKVVLQTGHSLDTFSDLKRAIAEPIIQQLVPKAMIATTEPNLQSSAIQVLLKFICNDSLLSDKISELLGHGSWMVPTLKFLGSLYGLDASFWKTNTLHSISCRLIDILQQHPDSDLQSQARRTLLRLCLCRNQNSDDAISTPEMLHQLAESLHQVQNPDLQHAAAGAFASLACWNARINCKIVSFPKVLEGLSQCMAEDHDPGVRKEAARAIRNLTVTCDTSILDKMARFPNLLYRLSEFLTEEDKPLLQEQAAAALGNLGSGHDMARRNFIANVPCLLERLVQSTSQDRNPGLQREAARALSNLLTTKGTFVSESSLHKLGKLLTTKYNLSLQEQATRGLARLATEEGNLVGKHPDFPILLNMFVHSTVQTHNMPLQMEVARTFLNLLATEDSSILKKIANNPDLLHRLGTVFREHGAEPAEDQISGFQKTPTLALQNSANTSKIQGSMPGGDIELFPGDDAAKDHCGKGTEDVPIVSKSWKASTREEQALTKTTRPEAVVKEGEGYEAAAVSKEGEGCEAEAGWKEGEGCEAEAGWKEGEGCEAEAVLKEGEGSKAEAVLKEGEGFEAEALLKGGEGIGAEEGERTKEDREEESLPSMPVHEQLRRLDAQSAGFVSWDQSFDSDKVFVLCDIRSEKEACFVFAHVEGMANLLGIGIPYSKISINLDEQRALVEEMPESLWKALWVTSSQEHFKLLLLEKSKSAVEDVPQSYEKKVLHVTKNDALSMFGISMDGPQVQEFVKMCDSKSQDVEGRIKYIPRLWGWTKNLITHLYPLAKPQVQGFHKPTQESDQHPGDTRSEVTGEAAKLSQRDSLIVDVEFLQLRCDFYELGDWGTLEMINGGCDLLRGISCIRPTLRVEFLQGQENSMITTLTSRYGMSNQEGVQWPAGWHQNDLVVSFGWSGEGEKKVLLKGSQSIECESEETEFTQQVGESRSVKLEASSQATVQVSPFETKVGGQCSKTSQASETTSRKSKSKGRKFLSSCPSYAVVDNTNSDRETMEFKAFLWGQANFEGSGSQSKAEMKADGTWLLFGGDKHTYDFKATKRLWRTAGEQTTGEAFSRLESWFADENCSIFSSPPKIRENVFQIFSRRFVLNHKFSEFFGTYKKPEPYLWMLIDRGDNASPIPNAMNAPIATDGPVSKAKEVSS